MVNGAGGEDGSRSRLAKRGTLGKSVKLHSQRAGSTSKMLDYDNSSQLNGSTGTGHGKMERATSELQIPLRRKDLTPDPDSKDEKKKSRGKSPFR